MTSRPKIKLTRKRTIPSGYLIGRLSAGHGDEELLSFGDLVRLLANNQVVSSGSAVTQAGFGFYVEGLMLANELIGSGVFGKDVTFPSGAVADNVTSLSVAAAQAVFTIATNNGGGPVTVGTITFAAGAKIGTVAWNAPPFTLAAGTTLYLYAPNPADTNLGWVTGLVEGDV